MSLRKQISKKLRKIRRDKEMSQDELAFKAKTSQTHIGQIERGDTGFTIDTLDKIMKVLKINLKDLI
ncbi:MAG: helix-turn-helix transcriptional regulator [Elusimicrobiaceae bacterium]|jgi:XRE family transcriptional regulator, regulator of sulfur utilization|nr:helix-turn-helix transcriptional regulator [Elusimicrobiaceae bacterium]MBT3954852.1 helix-turn-helix transcriptional regulator [Elusimicrobiaceae bacterium]MBT4008401.1 helix-turn-helix transcriptional regulator [Elusimicrobiaceae bacterium]MBT4402929.1 helix-turn-helix transcriptional regulator [Elusimicrobiaceae bacterium]MBT4439865.1 helix-turn-helix transcriptional regulator [Elusimicrobiaceae bacterium]